MKVEIVGLHKADVLLALYNNAKFAGKNFASQPMLKVMARMAPPGKREMAEKIIDEALDNNNCYLDYIDLGAGPRPIKANLSGFDFDPTQFDNNHGQDGYAAAIIDQLRAEYINQLQDEPKNSFAGLLSQIGFAFQAGANTRNSDHSSDEDSDKEYCSGLGASTSSV